VKEMNHVKTSQPSPAGIETEEGDNEKADPENGGERKPLILKRRKS